jgi:Zn-dependent protease with chaperone function
LNIEPRVPQETAENSRGSSSRKQFWVNSGLVIAFFAVLYFSLGWIAEGVIHFMRLSWDNRLSFSAPLDWTGSDTVPDEVRQLFEKVRAGSESTRKYHLYVIPDSDLNAYAFPGGHIALTSGLMELIDSEEALAFVIAHEIGHFEHRHMLKKMSRAVVFGFTKAVLFGQDPALGLLDRAEGLAGLGYSRRQEEQADEFALSCLNRTYGHVGGATTFFEQIENREWALQLLQTHPLPRSRIKRLGAMIQKKHFEVKPVTPIEPVENHVPEE